MLYLLLVVYAFLSALGLILFKLGANADNYFGIDNFFLRLNINLYMAIGVMVYVISFALYLFLVSRFNLAFLYPIGAGIIYTLILLATVFVFGEKLNAMAIMGGALIIAGIFFINMSGVN